jgi:hypothetical protein
MTTESICGVLVARTRLQGPGQITFETIEVVTIRRNSHYFDWGLEHVERLSEFAWQIHRQAARLGTNCAKPTRMNPCTRLIAFLMTVAAEGSQAVLD